MLKAFSNISFFCSIILCIKYRLPFYEYFFVIINWGLMLSFFRSEKLKDNFFVLFYLVYIFCSCHIVALFEMTSVGFFKDYITQTEYRQLSSWGTHLFFVILLTLNLLKPLFPNKNNIKMQAPRYMSASCKTDTIFIYFYIFVLFLQLISLKFNLASNQFAPKIVLPFHLNGIIDEIRSNIAAFSIAIYMFDRYVKNEKLNKKVIVVYIIYAFLEVIVRNSKGAFVYSFLPVVALMGFMDKINRNTIIKVVIPIIISLVILYPIVETARGDEQITISSMLKAAQDIKSEDMSEKSSPFIRSFLTGVYYTKVIGEVNSDEFSFDFSHVPILVLLRGGSVYMTRIIDGVPETIHHSSGVTGLNDALLWGGYLSCYIVVSFLTFIAIIGDKAKLMKKKPLYKVIFFFFFYDRIVGTTISFFIDKLLIPSLGSLFIKYILAKFYYKKIY